MTFVKTLMWGKLAIHICTPHSSNAGAKWNPARKQTFKFLYVGETRISYLHTAFVECRNQAEPSQEPSVIIHLRKGNLHCIFAHCIRTASYSNAGTKWNQARSQSFSFICVGKITILFVHTAVVECVNQVEPCQEPSKTFDF